MGDKLGPVLFIGGGIFLAFAALSGKAQGWFGGSSSKASNTSSTSNTSSKSNEPVATKAPGVPTTSPVWDNVDQQMQRQFQQIMQGSFGNLSPSGTPIAPLSAPSYASMHQPSQGSALAAAGYFGVPQIQSPSYQQAQDALAQASSAANTFIVPTDNTPELAPPNTADMATIGILPAPQSVDVQPVWDVSMA